VTGGARNVGAAINRRLAAVGATVVVNHFRSPAEARELCADIRVPVEGRLRCALRSPTRSSWTGCSARSAPDPPTPPERLPDCLTDAGVTAPLAFSGLLGADLCPPEG
jgi:NAD(P)-dependent dehydrogenase (short-subunit alcohol dehydrogenase family)